MGVQFSPVLLWSWPTSDVDVVEEPPGSFIKAAYLSQPLLLNLRWTDLAFGTSATGMDN